MITPLPEAGAPSGPPDAAAAMRSSIPDSAPRAEGAPFPGGPDRQPGVFGGRDLMCLRGERLVFANLSFDLHPGEAMVLLGPNGTGKSSLLRLMALLLRPAAGGLTWNSRPVTEDPEEHGGRSRYVGHLDAIKPVLALRENLIFWARLAGADDSRIDAALAALDLAHLAQVPGRMLSAGQKRRANLARLVAAPAPLWLLDEPTTALDRASIARLEGLIADHRRHGGMVVLSTHQDITLPGATVFQMDRFGPDRRNPAALFCDDPDPVSSGVRPGVPADSSPAADETL